MTDPSQLEARAVELYTYDCGAALDYPGAYCPACDHDPQDRLVPLEEGPDAADLWEARQAFTALDPAELPRVGAPVRLVPFLGVSVSPGASIEDRVALAEALGVDLAAEDRAALEAALAEDAASTPWPLELLGQAVAFLALGGLVLLFLVCLLVPDSTLVPLVNGAKAAAWAALPGGAAWAAGGLALGAFLGWALGRVTR